MSHFSATGRLPRSRRKSYRFRRVATSKRNTFFFFLAHPRPFPPLDFSGSHVLCTYTMISTVISFHCPPCDSILLESPLYLVEKVEQGREFSSKHRCILFLLSLFPCVALPHPCRLTASYLPLLLPTQPPRLVRLLLLHRSPSTAAANLVRGCKSVSQIKSEPWVV